MNAEIYGSSRDMRQWQQAGTSRYSQFSSFTIQAVEVAVAAADILLGPLLVPFFGPIFTPK